MLRRLFRRLMLVIPLSLGSACTEGPTTIEYAEVEGKSLQLDLLLPEQTNPPPPLIVYIHGGGWQGGTRKDVPPGVLALTDSGFALASIDYRLQRIRSHPIQIHDVKGAVRWLRANAERLGFQAGKIGVCGVSAGGQLAMLLATTGGSAEHEGAVGGNQGHSSRVQAVVNVHGPSDLLKLQGESPEFTEGAETSQLRSASPLDHVSSDDPALLLYHGDQDEVIPVSHSEDMHRRYAEIGLDSTLHIVPGVGHDVFGFDQDEMRELLKSFFDRHLRPPAKE